MADNPFEDLIKAQLDLEYRLGITEPKETPIWDKGTWSPTYLGLATAGTTTYTLQDGFWRRINSIILFNGRVTWTAATGTGVAIISLPFTAATAPSGTFRWGGSLWTNNVTIGTFSPQMLVTQATAYFTMNQPANNAAITSISVEGAGDVIFDGFYYI